MTEKLTSKNKETGDIHIILVPISILVIFLFLCFGFVAHVINFNSAEDNFCSPWESPKLKYTFYIYNLEQVYCCNKYIDDYIEKVNYADCRLISEDRNLFE